jgi:hypothetical protein
MRTIRAETTVDAPPDAVWSVLTDLDSYAAWNPHIVTAGGTPREGERVSITVQQRGRRRSSRPTVTVVDPPRRLQWVDAVGTAWLLETRHTFDLERRSDGRTLLVNREERSGVLAGLLVDDRDVDAYESMNWALAERVDRLQTADFSTETTH